MNADTLDKALDHMGGIDRLQARLSPGAFAEYAHRGWQYAPHLRLVDDAIMALLEDDEAKGIIVQLPPRHGKSKLLSETLPAWYVGTFPDKRVMLASYEARFAASWGRKARDLLIEYSRIAYNLFPRAEVRCDSRAADEWNIVGHPGGMSTAGVGGALTGKGADLLVIDDPVKNAEEALSERDREKKWDWFISTAETRLEPGGKTIIVQTRWHEDDLAGRVCREIQSGTRRGWRVLCLPALADAPDGLGRKPGEALWPERYDRAYFETLRTRLDSDESRLGPYWWDALYQQRPQPKEGGLFKRSWFRYWEDGQLDGRPIARFSNGDSNREVVHLGVCWKFATVDLAASLKEEADYTVVSVWAVTEMRDLILLEARAEKIAGPDQPRMIQSAQERYQLATIDVEAVQYQMALVQQLVRMGLPAVAIRPRGDKVARAQAFAARMEAGAVFFPKHAGNLPALESELLVFPRGKHDDFVDTCSMAADRMANASGRVGQVRMGF